MAGENVITWRTCEQPQIARSTTDSEATAMAMNLNMIDFVISLQESMSVMAGPGLIKCDNKAAIVLATGEGTWKTKALANRSGVGEGERGVRRGQR